MSDKKFFKLILSYLESIDKNTKTFIENDEVFIDCDEPIYMEREVYEQICEELDKDYITFMGITQN